MIYLIADYSAQAIKIGYTNCDPLKRLSQLQCGNSNKLTLLNTIKGGLSSESKLHLIFDKYHKRGEWFHMNDEIMEYFNEQENVEYIPKKDEEYEYVLNNIIPIVGDKNDYSGFNRSFFEINNKYIRCHRIWIAGVGFKGEYNITITKQFRRKQSKTISTKIT
tara:strand:+ start:40544 stop:41032 length:489 start_codon:yes stop_codon:yes gene_type:complete